MSEGREGLRTYDTYHYKTEVDFKSGIVEMSRHLTFLFSKFYKVLKGLAKFDRKLGTNHMYL